MQTAVDMPLRLYRVWLTIGIALVIAIFYLSLTPAPPQLAPNVSDKTLHIFSYVVLSGWFGMIYHSRKAVAVIALLTISMGVSIEFLQEWGGSRHFEYADMLANSVGVAIGSLLSLNGSTNLLYWLEQQLLK